jgi:hypothetical protein
MYSWLLRCIAEDKLVRAASRDLLMVTAMVGEWGARAAAAHSGMSWMLGFQLSSVSGSATG